MRLSILPSAKRFRSSLAKLQSTIENLQSEFGFGVLAQLVERRWKGSRALLHGQIFFNLVDQLGNIDWLGEGWTPLDVEAGPCLRFRD